MRRIAFLLVGAGSMALVLCAAFVADAWIAQRRAGSELETRIQVADPHESVEPGDAIGRIEIARLGISSVIMEGSDKATLRHGVGHIPGTAFPGRGGNVGLAGHRDTFLPCLATRPRERLDRPSDAALRISLPGDFNDDRSPGCR
jgi:sortase A